MNRALISNISSSQFRYGGNFFSYTIVVATGYLVMFLYIDALFQFANSVGGYGPLDFYFILYISAFVGLTANIFEMSVYRFFREWACGSIVPFLTQPRSIAVTMLFRWARVQNIPIIFVFLIAWPFFDHGFGDRGVDQWILGILAMLLGVVAILCFVIGISLLTVYTHREMPVDFVSSEVHRLNILPLGVYPSEIRLWTVAILPSIFSASIPAHLFLGGEINIFLFFAFCTSVFGLIVWRLSVLALSAFDHLGG